MELITKFTRGGFSLLERRTRLNEQNKLYKTTKDHILYKTGLKVGAAEGTIDLVMGTVSFLATPDKLPAKIKAIGGVFENAVSNAVSNPRAVASNLSSSFYGWLTQQEADPLKRGKTVGRAVAFDGAFFVVGGGAGKTVVKAANRASKVAGTVTKTSKAAAVVPKVASTTPKTVTSGIKAKILTEKAWHSITRGLSNVKPEEAAVKTVANGNNAKITAEVGGIATTVKSIFEKGDVCTAIIKCKDGSGCKARPVLVIDYVSKERYRYKVAEITSVPPKGIRSDRFKEPIELWKNCDLYKKSYVNIKDIYLKKAEELRKFGVMDPKDFKRIYERMSK